MKGSIFSHIIIKVGPVEITDVVVTSWGVIVFLAIICLFLTRGLDVWRPGKRQIVIEAIVETIANTIRSTINTDPWPFVPLIGGMWIYIGTLNLVNLIPHLHNPTRDLSTTSALAAISFMSVHYYGIKYNGLEYLKHYIKPVFILAPFNVFAEFSRTMAMAIRLFGNMLSWEMIVAILLLLAGLLVPIPLILLSLVGDLIQAYLFGVLTLVFIAGSIRIAEEKGLMG